MQRLTYEKIRGNRIDTCLYWIPQERYLHVKKEERGGKIECICYQTVLANRKNKDAAQILNCTARRLIDSENQVSSNGVPHSNHGDHQIIYNNLITRKNIVDTCIGVKNLLGDMPVKVSVGDVFTRELAK